jgi:hypothetical protein
MYRRAFGQANQLVPQFTAATILSGTIRAKSGIGTLGWPS